MDEFALFKGHRYASVILDADTRRVLWVAEGRTRVSVRGFFQSLGPAGCAPIRAVAMDMNSVFDLEVRKHCPQARIIYDLFHVVAKYDREVISRVHADAANALRHDKPARRVVKQAHWLLLRNRASLGDRVRVRLENVLHSSRGLWRACQRPNDLTKAWATGFLALLHARASRQRFSPRTVQAAPAESSRCAIWQRPPDAALRRGHRGA